MKKTCFILAMILFLVMALDASAQFMSATGGSRNYASPDGYTAFWLGYSPASLKEGSYSTSGFNLFSIGITRASALAGSSFMAECGGYVEWMNKSVSDSGNKASINVAGVKIPFNLMYPFALADGITIYPYAGLNGRLLIFGKLSGKYDGETGSVDIFGDDDFGVKRLNLGYQVGLRARISNILVGIGYEDMLTTLLKDDTVKLNGVVLSVGFPF